MSFIKNITLILASLRARPRFYLQTDGTTVTLHELRRSTHAYTVTTTHTARVHTLATLSSFLDRAISVKERTPFSVVVSTTEYSQVSDNASLGPGSKPGEASLGASGMILTKTSIIAALHRLGLSPYGFAHRPLFAQQKESIARVKGTAPRDGAIPTLIYAAGATLLTSFLLCSSLAAWSIWYKTKQQQFVLAQQKKWSQQEVVPANTKVMKSEAVGQVLEKLANIVSSSLPVPGSLGVAGNRCRDILTPGSPAGKTILYDARKTTLRETGEITSQVDKTSPLTLHAAMIKKGVLRTTLRSYDKNALEKYGTPTPVTGCHPPLWELRCHLNKHLLFCGNKA